jgi:hypothetical protein
MEHEPSPLVCDDTTVLPKRDGSPFHLFLLRLGWEFANTLLLLASLVLLFFLMGTPVVRELIGTVGSWDYVGAFVTGIFFTSTFTLAPAAVVLFSLAHVLSPLPLALSAGAGAMIGDYVIFRFVRDHLVREWMPVYCRIAGTPMGRVFSSPLFAWFAPVIGAFIIASPLPDELGVGMLGIARVKTWKMLVITFTFNVIGVFGIVLLARA